MDRRSILKAGLGGLAAATLPPCLRAAAEVGAAPETTRLNDRLTVVSGVGCNVLALTGPEGLTLVDSGAAAHTSALLKSLRDLPNGKRVQTLFNTHWHPDQTGANEALGKGGTAIIAHEKTRLWLGTDHWVPAEERYEKARPKAALPTHTFYTDGQMSVGSERVEYGYLIEAHTDGDCYVFCRDSNVLAVGHAASPVRDPELDWFAGGWIGGRLDALALLIKLSNDDTRVVPAFGPVIGRAQLKAELDLLQQVYDRSVTYLRKAFNYQEMLDAGVLQGLPRTWADSKTFMYSVCKGLWAHHNMLTHDIV
jgi:glyoxylase-like metal-dependent hydrolase (beta-lactamase superfamily II)